MSKLSQITPILGYTKVSDELFLPSERRLQWDER